MIDPARVVIPPTYPEGLGLYRFKDGEAYLVKRHYCGDWQTIRNANADEKKFMSERKEDK